MKTILTMILALLVVMSVASAVNYATSYSVWQDMDDDGIKDTYLGQVTTFNEGVDVVTAYDYYSYSSHMTEPAPEAYTSKVWLYKDEPSKVSLGMFHDIDGGGSPNNFVSWDISIVYATSQVTFADESHELVADYSYPYLYYGRWHYWHNTDGGIITVDELPGWYATIEPNEFGDVERWIVASADGNDIELNMDHRAFITTDTPTNDVPEFGTIASMLVLTGVGLFVFARHRKY